MSKELKPEVNFLINSLAKGGAQRALLTLSRWFMCEGFKVTIISLTKNDEYSIPEGLNIVYLSKMNESRAFVNMLYLPYHAWKLKRYASKNKIMLIQSHLFRANYVNILSRILGSRHKVQVANRSVASRYLSAGVSGKINLSLMKYLYPRADKIICVSRKMLADLNQLFSFSNKKVVIYNPYDIESILVSAEEAVHEFTFNPDKYYLVTVGRFISLKRYKDILTVMSSLDSEIELLMLGDGEELEELKFQAKKLSIIKRVHFLGHVENPYKFVKNCDIFISTSSIEGFPNVLVEAMLCKAVVVSADCHSGPREILAPKTNVLFQLKDSIENAEYGILFPVGDLKRLQEAIVLIVDNPEQRQEYKEKAFLRAYDFSVEEIALKYKDIIFNSY